MTAAVQDRTALTDRSPDDRGAEEGVRIRASPLHIFSCANIWDASHQIARCQVIDHSRHDCPRQLRDEHRPGRNLKHRFSEGTALPRE